MCENPKNEAKFEFDELIPKPYRHDQPAQRFRESSFLKRLDRKPGKSLSLRTLSPNPIRRDQPAQRLRVNSL
ncbi:hypothetical protein [Methanosarcina sp. Kolksee]|uniref:hypothetical protein n=1 Tax=Methanosarcina sp. Kolksee TaxID=1434099 RepID=UPI0012E09E7F|nr:hypothetical protein [Methanosarcina sp. Kolksee]